MGMVQKYAEHIFIWLLLTGITSLYCFNVIPKFLSRIVGVE